MAESGVHQPEAPGAGAIRLLFSTAWPGLFEIGALPDPGIRVTVTRRSVDWDMSRWRHAWVAGRDCIRLARAGRRHDVTIICTGGLESFVVPLLWLLFRVRQPLLLLDPIALSSRRLDRLWGIGLRRVALVLCIRRGDIATYGRRFGVPEARCRFVAMPTPPLDTEPDTEPAPAEPAGSAGSTEAAGGESDRPGEYLYSAGLAHRDWGLLFRACEGLPYRCVVSTPSTDLEDMRIPDNVEVHPALSPAQGRRIMRQAALVAVTFEDTDLACGPTIVLDALAMGIPVVANDTNACRDYVDDGVTGLISATTDGEGLARNITTLMEDPALRRRMATAARRQAEGELSRAVFEEKLCALVREAVGGRHPAGV